MTKRQLLNEKHLLIMQYLIFALVFDEILTTIYDLIVINGITSGGNIRSFSYSYYQI